MITACSAEVEGADDVERTSWVADEEEGSRRELEAEDSGAEAGPEEEAEDEDEEAPAEELTL